MQGLIGGLGFLGGGAILKSNGSVQGMATAASIWSAGAIGMAAAYGQWEVAVVLSLMNALTLRFGTEVKEAVGHDGEEKDDQPSQD
jgi:putative Mg2+ transporter-C (MgtC) family protein